MKKNNKKGFTLVELVIVVAVMAVLVAVAIPTIGSITGTAKDAVADSNARAIESVIKLAEANVSKTGDGVGTLKAENIGKAVYEAKLGIIDEDTTDTDVPTFYYDPKTGNVLAELADGDDGSAYSAISFDENGDVTVGAVPGVTGDKGGEYAYDAATSKAKWTAAS